MKLLTVTLVASLFLFGPGPVREPLKVAFENSASYRWLNKKVLKSRPLDDMESLAGWEAYTDGSEAIVDARVATKVNKATNVAEISLSTERVHHGSRSLLMRTPTRLEVPAPKNGRGWGRSGVRR